MKPIDMAKAILALVGISVWGYGVRIGNRPAQIAGVVCVVAAFSLRLLSRLREPPL